MIVLTAAMAMSSLLLAAPTTASTVKHESRDDDDQGDARHGIGTPGREDSTRVAGNVLGELDALVSVCSAADPSSAAKYWELNARLIAGISERSLRDARSTADYQESHKTFTALLNGIPRQQRGAACHFLFFGK